MTDGGMTGVKVRLGPAENVAMGTRFPSGFLKESDTPTFSFAAIDLETTGFGKQARIVELGIATNVVLKDGGERQRFGSLVNPSPQGETLNVHPQVWRVNGIKPEWLSKAPPFERFTPLIAQLLSERWVIGHNIGAFDIPILQEQMRACGASLRQLGVFDTRRLARTLGMGTLEQVAERYGLRRPPHCAPLDAQVALQVMAYMIRGRSVTDTLAGFGYWTAESGMDWFTAPARLLSHTSPRNRISIPRKTYERPEFLQDGQFLLIPRPRPGTRAFASARDAKESPFLAVVSGTDMTPEPGGY